MATMLKIFFIALALVLIYKLVFTNKKGSSQISVDWK